MHVSPVGMVGDTDVLHRHRRVVVGGDGEGERSIRSGDNHTVAIRLLDVAPSFIYLRTDFPFQIPHKSGFAHFRRDFGANTKSGICSSTSCAIMFSNHS